MKKKLNQFEAAVHVKMSPKLLKWFTKNAPKYNESRKLKCAEVKDEIAYYKFNEIEQFNSYLSNAWPTPPNSSRPNIPKGIRKEIERESGGKCAICGFDECEFAHIDPVSNSKNNHPHNLIYLCPNCHTKYDKKKKYTLNEMRMIKNDILTIQVIKWISYSKLFNSLISLTGVLDTLQDSKDKLDAAVYDELEKQVLKKIKKSIKEDVNEEDTNEVRYRNSEKYDLYRTKVKNVLKGKDVVEKVISCRDEYIETSREEKCPLCHGTGIHNNWECPVCRGIGTVDETAIDEIDLAGFEQENCPLCEGKGMHNNWECPICRNNYFIKILTNI